MLAPRRPPISRGSLREDADTSNLNCGRAAAIRSAPRTPSSSPRPPVPPLLPETSPLSRRHEAPACESPDCKGPSRFFAFHQLLVRLLDGLDRSEGPPPSSSFNSLLGSGHANDHGRSPMSWRCVLATSPLLAPALRTVAHNISLQMASTPCYR
ncbi:hypothetical protein VTO73DRAFT_9344 [Trametes versicolor]